jgi:purine-binding chemotaxis protein CheW
MKDLSDLPKMLAGDYTCFTIENQAYGIRTDQVLGVHPPPSVRRVPRAPDFMAGVANVGGRILPVVDTSRRLTDLSADAGALILTRLDGVDYGLLAQQVSRVHHLPPAAIEPVNPVLMHNSLPFISAMATIDGQLIHLLDLSALIHAGLKIDTQDRQAYRAFQAGRVRIDPHTRRISHPGFLIMTIGEETYALALETLKQIVSADGLRPVAGAPGYVAGRLKQGAAHIPVIDMMKKFGLDPLHSPADRRIVVVEQSGASYGLIVDTAGKMMAIAPDAIQDTPSAIAGQTRHIKNVAMPAGSRQLIMILDHARILTAADRRALAEIEEFKNPQRVTKTQADKGDAVVASFLIFEVAGHEFALNIQDLAEVIAFRPVTRVPQAPDHIRGLIPVKGKLAPITDLRKKLALPPAGAEDEKRIIIIRAGQGLCGVIADRVCEIAAVAETDLIAPDALAACFDKQMVRRVIRMPAADRLPMVLNWKAWIE